VEDTAECHPYKPREALTRLREDGSVMNQ
jgi:hypothetical protein